MKDQHSNLTRGLRQLLLTAAALLPAACAEQAEKLGGADSDLIPVTVTAAAAGSTATSPLNTDTRTANTGLYTSSFATGDEFYAVMTGTTVDATTFKADGPYTTSNWTPAVQPYVRSGATATISGYFPWRNVGGTAGNASPTLQSWTVRQDQTAENGYWASDLMYAPQKNIGTGGKVQLEFHHRMAKVIVKVTNNISATIQAVNLVQGYRTVNIQTPATLTTGTTLTDPIGQTTPLNVSTGDVPDAGVACLLPPQAIKKDQRFIEIKTDLGTAYFALTSDQSLLGGTEYTATVTLGRAAIGATTAITGWTAGTAPTTAEQSHIDFTIQGAGSNESTFRMVYVEGGTYTTLRGQTVTGTLTNYYCGQTEVYNNLWWDVYDATRGTPARPAATSMSYNQVTGAGEFLVRLNRKTAGQRPAGYSFQLLTEAQWEYAARGGKRAQAAGTYNDAYAGTNELADVTEYAWCAANAGGAKHDVATRHANELGLYDMSGNVFEMVLDRRSLSDEAIYTQFTSGQNLGADYVQLSGTTHMVCQRAHNHSAAEMALTQRGHVTDADNTGYYNIGFRLALTKDVEQMTVAYPAWTKQSGDDATMPVTQYDYRDRFGLYIVNEAGALLHSNLPLALKSGSTTELDLEPLRQQGIALSPTARYFLYYPYRESPGSVMASATTADGFFSGWTTAAAWAPARDQSTLALLKAQDLQTAASVPTASRTTVSFAPAHQRGMAVLRMAASTTDSNIYRVYQPSATTTTTTVSNNATNGAFYALDEFDGNQPYRVGQRNTAGLRCFYITRTGVSDVLFSSSYYIINESGTKIAAQWGMNSNYNITAGGQYQMLSTTVPGYKNLAFVYTNSTPSTAVSGQVGMENGTVQTYTLPFPTSWCAYQIECWGAQGGSCLPSNPAYFSGGGYGGYVSGTTTPQLDLQAGDRLYVYCGGAGDFQEDGGYKLNAWNGGGKCLTDGGASGGGASDVRTVNAAWNDPAGLRARIIVAGGGGGCNDQANGGYGGKTGGAGGYTYTINCKGGGATQTAGGTGGVAPDADHTAGAAGTFGVGGDGGDYDGGAGGGGWYGGGGASFNREAGGGGSSYARPDYFANVVYLPGSGCNGQQNSNNQATSQSSWTSNAQPDPTKVHGNSFTGTWGRRELAAAMRGYVRITCEPYGKP